MKSISSEMFIAWAMGVVIGALSVLIPYSLDKNVVTVAGQKGEMLAIEYRDIVYKLVPIKEGGK